MISLTPLAFFSTSLPQHCQPAHPFLHSLSATLGVCIPTPLAFASTLLGTLSIISWLFAQLPQLIKNYRLRTASGLSIWFLVEWCSGDVANLAGAILTGQATWQIIIGAYYCFVDFSLLLQWLWYEQLRHGAPLRSIWRSKLRRASGGKGPADATGAAMTQVVDRIQPVSRDGDWLTPATPEQRTGKTTPLPCSRSIFRTPNYATITADATDDEPIPAAHRHISRLQSSSPLPSPSPRTVLFLTLLIALASPFASATASPLQSPVPSASAHRFVLPSIGTLLSWLSTTLYLCSRLPQLLRNARLRSTAGLSPLLFLAAFSGNAFYSASLLCNPLAWSAADPYGLRGWAGAGGSEVAAWRGAAAPFFLGAAGVLLLDAAVGLQFCVYSSTASRSEERVLVVSADDVSGGGMGKGRWREVSGWMRGWKPRASNGTPEDFFIAGAVKPGAEEVGLLAAAGGEAGYGAT